MILACNINLFDTEYILVTKFLKTKSIWYLFSKVHPEDYLKPLEEQLSRKITINDLLISSKPEYLVESMSCMFNNSVSYYKNYRLLSDILDAYNKSRTYGYSKEERLQVTSKVTPQGIMRKMYFKSTTCYIDEEKVGAQLNSLSFGYGNIDVPFVRYDNIILPKISFVFVENIDEFKTVELLNVNTVTYEMLKSIIDLSWYESSDGSILRDYSHVSTKIDFESKVITPMVYEILRCKEANIKCLVGIDTETDGLNVHYLSESNKDRSHAVSVQVSWRDNQGVNIYLDMVNFSNAPTEYVMARLSKLFCWHTGEFDFNLYYDLEGNPINDVIRLNRQDYLAGGHNFPFDSKVFRVHGNEIFFDEDTLQMAFTVAPTSFKIKKGLKHLTKKLLGIESPELTDILGKGNEDKFRYLVDTTVADIYGCADVDMFRFVWKALRKLMGDKLYKAYKRIDIYTCNVLAKSEFYGVRLDEKYVLEHADFMEKDLKILEEKIYEFTGKLLLMKTSSTSGITYTEDQFNSASYRFKVSGNDLTAVLYKYLGYPVKVLTDKGQPAVNQFAIDKLLMYKNKEPSNFLKSNIMSSSGNTDHVIVDKDEFNSYKYPLAYLLKVYSKLRKEYTGYYKPFKESDTEGRLFRPFKTANIETRRISCATQVVKKDLKKCILPHLDDWNLCDADMAQVESRIFTSFGGDENLIKLMDDGDKDYHTENGSLIYNVPAHLLKKSDRAKAKSIGFGYPYGLSLFKMCERMFKVINQKTKLMTSEIIDIFERVNRKAVDVLLYYRSMARKDANIDPEVRKFLEIEEESPVSVIYNENGFYRYQDMTDIIGDNRRLASVERMFGNFPIQSFAADLFKVLICRLDRRIRKEGLQDKIIFHMYIHDEILFSFHKSIDPKFIVKIIKEECMVKLKGHTSYYWGINFGKTWYECKLDESELPVKYVQRMCKSFNPSEFNGWCDSPADLFAPEVEDFKKDRVIECLELYCTTIKQFINLDTIMDSFSNYTVRSYLYSLPTSYNPKIDKYDSKGKPKFNSDDLATSAMVNCLLEKGYSNTLLIFGNKKFTIGEFIKYKNRINSDSENLEYDNDDIDIDLDEIAMDSADDEFWSFDDSESSSSLFFYVNDDNEFDELEEKAKELSIVHKDNYEFVETINKSKILYVESFSKVSKLESILLKYKSPTGSRVVIDYGGRVVNSPILYSLPSDQELESILEDLNKDTLDTVNMF